MQVVHERCSGLDVHKQTVVACVLTPEGQQTRSFGTTTRALRELADWLAAQGVTHVAMESTGVYWKPVYNVLEARGFTLLVVNAQQIKAIRAKIRPEPVRAPLPPMKRYEPPRLGRGRRRRG